MAALSFENQQEQQAALFFAKLANASTLSDCIFTRDEALLFYGARAPMVALAMHSKEVLQAWLAALAHGYRLFLAEQQQWASASASANTAGLFVLITLHMSLSSLLSAADEPDMLQFSVQFSVLSVRT
eukprot:gene13843-13964_t